MKLFYKGMTKLGLYTPHSIKKNVPNDTLYSPFATVSINGAVGWNSTANDKLITESFNKGSDLYSIITKIGELASNVQWGLFDYSPDGTKKQIVDLKNPYIRLLTKPNDYEEYREFAQKYLAYLNVMGNTYLHKMVSVGFEGRKDLTGTSLHVLPAQYTSVIVSKGGTNNYLNREVLGYLLKYTDVTIQEILFRKESILHRKNIQLNVDDQNYLYGLSPLVPANSVTTALKYNEEAKASIFEERGAMGFISNNSEQITPTPTDAKTLQDKLKENYGLQRGRNKIIVTAAKMAWQQMGLPISELDLIGNHKADFAKLCRVYDIDPLLLGVKENSLFSNPDEARKDFYLNQFRAVMMAMFSDFTMMVFGERAGKFRYEPLWDTIPALMKDKDVLSKRLMQEIERGVLKPTEARSMLHYEEDILAIDKYILKTSLTLAPEPEPTSNNNDTVTTDSKALEAQRQAQANLRGSVGGVQGILSIQSSVIQGVTDYDSAVTILVEIYGFEDSVARNILGVNSGTTEGNKALLDTLIGVYKMNGLNAKEITKQKI